MPADARPCAPASGDWLNEIKHDGFRLMVQRAGARVRLLLAGRFEEVFEEIHEETAAVRARLHRVELEEAERAPNGWLH